MGRLGGGSQEQDMVRPGLGPGLNSDSRSAGRKRTADFYWLEEQREEPWHSRGLSQKGRSSSSVPVFWGTAHACEEPQS